MGRVGAGTSVVISLLGLLLVVAAVWGVGPAGRSSLPVEASRDAVAVDWQFRVLVGVAGPIFVFACFALCSAAWRTERFPKTSQDRGEQDPPAVGPNVDGPSPTDWRASRASWLTPTLLAIVLLAVTEFSGWGFGIPAAGPVSDSQLRADDSPTTVWARIRIREFECRVSYPGADCRLGTLDDIHVAGELRIPLNEVVAVQLEADDGPHRWYVPALRLSVNLRPGRPVQIPLGADVPGQYGMIRVDLSGCRQDATPGKLLVLPADDVRQWLDSQNEEQQSRQLPASEVRP